MLKGGSGTAATSMGAIRRGATTDDDVVVVFRWCTTNSCRIASIPNCDQYRHNRKYRLEPRVLFRACNETTPSSTAAAVAAAVAVACRCGMGALVVLLVVEVELVSSSLLLALRMPIPVLRSFLVPTENDDAPVPPDNTKLEKQNRKAGIDQHQSNRILLLRILVLAS